MFILILFKEMYKGFVTDKSEYVKDKLLNEFKSRQSSWSLLEAYHASAQLQVPL